jgi:phospholipase A2
MYMTLFRSPYCAPQLACISQLSMLSVRARSTLARSPMIYSIRSHSTKIRYPSAHRKTGRAGRADRPKPRLAMAPLSQPTLIAITSSILVAGLFYILYENDYVQPLPATRLRSDLIAQRKRAKLKEKKEEEKATENVEELADLPFPVESNLGEESSAWTSFSIKFNAFSALTEIEWAAIADTIAGYVVPEWAIQLPGYIQKLQRELSMAPGSLADEIWQEAHDPFINPEINHSASVRVSMDLCDEEKEFLEKRKKFTTKALARYLGIPEEDVHPDDVPTIAIVGSGGGLRALLAGTGSLLACDEDGLFDCVTYTAGVSGSCWLQTLFHSSLGGRRLDKMVDHLKARLGVHIAYPPVALAALNTAPTNKFLLSGFVEKLKGDPSADFGLVDVYGLLLAARLLVPKDELGVDNRDLKISNQRDNIKHGEFPMPIYTAVRHEIPVIEKTQEEENDSQAPPSEAMKEKAKREAWFQWFEFTPYEFFCEEFAAGIPTWAVGRKFKNGQDLPHEKEGLYMPELRIPLLLGVFGSAFCATLSHYYKEVKPLVKGLTGFGTIDGMISGRNEDLSKVHPIDPATIPNFAYGMEGQLPDTTPESIYKNEHIQLMDAGMSNNLPIYPLLRPGRDVDVLIAFDASADIKTENWLSVADGYARQRGVKGWPIGVGWPKASDTAEKTAAQLDDAQAATTSEAADKLTEAKKEQQELAEGLADAKGNFHDEESGDLGYCTVWVGTTQERSYDESSEASPPSKTKSAEDWELTSPDAGIAIVYFPFLANPRVADVDPTTSDFMSTWNFVYTPEQVDKVVELARTNFDEGRERTRRTIRAVYERKRAHRLEAEKAERAERFRRKMRMGIVGRDGDHFS